MPRHPQQGFSLIELVVTIAILAIVVSIAVPSFQNTQRDWRVEADRQTINQALNLARQTAITNQATVLVCPTADRVNCNNNWANPLMVYIERTAPAGQVNAGDRVLTATEAVANVTRSYNNGNTLTFTRTGAINNPGTLTICPGDGTRTSAQALVVSFIGRARLATDGNADGIVEGGNGQNVNCP